MAGGWVPTGCATVATCCPSVCSGRLGWLADRGTELCFNKWTPRRPRRVSASGKRLM
ncbi:hypothetical protein BGY98DRAFT_974223 [Russula aff. rugulosa BPL654]|nr:hypothetical protein BGY98DRAFT_974223 [Russula aff. rugulosa BPL654]